MTERDAALAEKLLERSTGNFLADARHIHSMMSEFDWYALAGTRAERLLHERLTALVSCSEFGVLIEARTTP